MRDAQPDTACVLPDCVSTPGNQDYVIVFSAGNSGPALNTVHAPGLAKNVITVGAAENVSPFGGSDGSGVSDNGANNANDIISFSSRGPTADGRKKPDIMAPGTHTSGGVAQASIASPAGSGTGTQLGCFTGVGVSGGPGGSNFWPLAQQYWTASSGTSHSGPAVAGVAALIRQHFINLALPPASAAMTKALMMNSARYMTGVGANDTLPSNSQGMGEVSLNNYFDVFTTAHTLQDQLPNNLFTASGQARVISGTVADNTKALRVTLAWTDAAGPTTGNAFVNNLDLEVTAGGNTYKGNVFTGAFSTPAGAADTRNNTENIFIPAGVTGPVVVRVKATNIAGDGVPNNATPLDQDYALVIYNVTEVPTAVMASDVTAVTAEDCAPGNGAIDPDETVTVNFSLSNIGTANTTSLVATLQPGGGVLTPSGPQNYGVVTATGPAVARAFTFTVAATCGGPITATFQLQDGAANLGTVTFSIPVGTLGTALPVVTYGTGNLTTAIPDNAAIDIPIAVTDLGAVSDINVRVRLDHTSDADLQMSIVSPDGTSILLVNNRGAANDNFGNGTNDCSGNPTIFNDSAASPITSGTAPFVGNFRPEVPLTGLIGASMAGTWNLHIVDTVAGNTGTVGCVQLEIVRQPFECCVAGAATPTPSPTATPTPTPTPTPSPTPTASPIPIVQALNLSTRLRILTGDSAGIAGFIITGSSPKTVLLRAIGPSLAASVPDALADPTLELHGSGGFVTVTNNNWHDDAAQALLIQSTGIPPTNDLESAIYAVLPPGVYSGIVRGNGDTTGVGLIEIYDVSQGLPSKLANISTRAFVSTGDEVVIAGFILGNGSVSDTLVLRGIGPSLGLGWSA